MYLDKNYLFQVNNDKNINKKNSDDKRKNNNFKIVNTKQY